MAISTFILALWVLLMSVPAFGWFSVDPKFTACVGIAFVICVVLEALSVIPAIKRRSV